MNLNKNAVSLHQSIENWIESYKSIHACGHDAAHDAFEEWVGSLHGVQADQTSYRFHEAVKASHADMEAKRPKTVQVEATVLTSQGKVSRLTVTPVGDVRGGPLLELPHESRSANRSLAATNIREEWKNSKWSEPGCPSIEAAPFGGPILDTGKDPLSFNDGVERIQPVVTTDVVQAQLKDAIRINQFFLDNKRPNTPEVQITRAKEIIALAEDRLKLIQGVHQRDESRQRKRLSLKPTSL